MNKGNIVKFIKALLLELGAALLFGAVFAGIVYYGITTSPLYG